MKVLPESFRRCRRGDTRSDGFRFFAYQKRGVRTYECWLSPVSFEKQLARSQSYYRENRNTILARIKRNPNRFANNIRWAKKHREQANAICRNWSLKNKDRCRGYQRKWQAANPDKVRERNKRFRDRHKEERNRLNRLWTQQNPGKRSAIRAKYNSLVYGAIPPDADLSIIQTIYDCCSRVSRCIGIQHHVDHRTPVSKGGKHHHINLQVLPAILNLRKGATV
jgi:hypothetical protein